MQFKQRLTLICMVTLSIWSLGFRNQLLFGDEIAQKEDVKCVINESNLQTTEAVLGIENKDEDTENGVSNEVIVMPGTTTPAVISVDLPTKINMMIDAYNIYGKGQVICEDIIFKNHSDIPINISIERCDINLPNSSDIIFLESLTEGNRLDKWLFLYLKDLNNDNQYYCINSNISDLSIGTMEKKANKVVRLEGKVNAENGRWNERDTFSVKLIFNFEAIIE